MVKRRWRVLRKNTEVVRGETIEFIVDYDLFGVNIMGMYGTIARKDSGNGRPWCVCMKPTLNARTNRRYVYQDKSSVVSTESLKFYQGKEAK